MNSLFLLDSNLKLLHSYSDKEGKTADIIKLPRRLDYGQCNLDFRKQSKQTESFFFTDAMMSFFLNFISILHAKPLCNLQRTLQNRNKMLVCIYKLDFTGPSGLFPRLFTLAGLWHTLCIHYSKQTKGCLAIKANYLGFCVTVAVLLHG